MERKRTYRVKDVAEIAKVSVRALHHYDEIGLLVPSGRSRAGYRLYGDDDLLRLQQIVLFRDLGLPLEEIRRALDAPGFDREKALLDVREILASRLTETAAKLRAVDAALALVRREDSQGDPMDRRDLFEGFDPAKHETEAKARWGNTEAYAESARRTKSYTEEDWARFKEEQGAIYGAVAAAMSAGEPPTSGAAMEAADRHRQSIDRWFYPCDATMHRGLADLYENDPRFAENIDKVTPGLTSYLVAAIRANAEQARERSGESSGTD